MNKSFYHKIWSLYLEGWGAKETPGFMCWTRPTISNYYVKQAAQSKKSLHNRLDVWWSDNNDDIQVKIRGELSYLAPLGSENISTPYFKQCFFREGITPPDWVKHHASQSQDRNNKYFILYIEFCINNKI